MAALIEITNQEFLEKLAGDQWRRVPISWGEDSWWVRPAGKHITTLDPALSNYMTCSLFHLDEVGRFIRKKHYFERQFVFLIDDVGTKLNEGAVRLTMPPATYELETSPGNFQFGYKLVNGTDARALDALVVAIVDNPDINPSLKDPGMVGVTRVARLPVGSNNKEKWKDKAGMGWRHRMHVWEPSRAYTVEELADWLDVDLSPPALEKFRGIAGTRKATPDELAADPILKLFDRKDMLLDPTPNDSGFVTVVCPWAAEHSDGREEAGYRPGMGGFKCHHGHCESRGMDDLKRWVAENTAGEERAQALAETFGDVPQDDPLLVAEVELAQERHKEKTDKETVVILKVRSEWAYIVGLERYGRISDNTIHTEKSFNRECRNIAPYGKSGEKAAAAIFINEMNPVRCKTASYAPGEKPICVDPDGGGLIFNTWRPSGVTEFPLNVTDADIAPWLDHVDFILPDPVARDTFLNWCAFLIQKPGRKINWAFLLTGGQGVGKDSIIRPIQGILGKDNYQAITAEDISGPNQDWAENQLVILEELPSFHKRDVYDWLKRFTAAGAPFFRVNKKFIPQYNVRNIQNWFIMSNHDDAMALESDDRRYFVYRSPAKKRDASYYLPLVDADNGLFNDPGFQSKVLSWLSDYDISKFNPGAPPPMTDSKRRMIEETRNPVDRWLDEEFDEGGRFNGRKFFQAKEAVSAILSEGRMGGEHPDLQKINTTKVGRWLRQHGWVQLDQIRGDSGRLRLWVAPRSPVSLLGELSGKQLEEKYLEDARRIVADKDAKGVY